MNKENLSIMSLGHVRVSEWSWTLEFKPEFKKALIGMEGFSHIQVLFWLHLHDTEEDRTIITCKKPYKKGPDVLGVFATRSDFRPNPIGLTVCPVKSIDPGKGIIEVYYIDTEDKTPVIDVKPYHPGIDRVRKVALPGWCRHWPQWYEESGEFDWASEFMFPVS